MGKVKLLADREEREAGSETDLSSVQLLNFHLFHSLSPQPNQECYHKDIEHMKTETENYVRSCSCILFKGDKDVYLLPVEKCSPQ